MPIYVAAFYGHMEVLEYLLQHGAEVDALTSVGACLGYEFVMFTCTVTLYIRYKAQRYTGPVRLGGLMWWTF